MLTWFVGLLLIAATAQAKVVVLDTCDQVVGAGGAAMLAADLDCSGSAAFSAVSMFRGRVILNGFTITAPSSGVALRCEQRCKILGPGTVVGGVFLGGFGRSIRVSDTTMTGSGGTAFENGAVRLIRVTVTGFDSGLHGIELAKIFDSTLTGTGQPGFGIAGSGGALVKLRNSSVSGFGDIGITNDRVQLIDSAVTGNGIDPSCSGFCGDLRTWEPPILLGTSSCGTSWDVVGNVPWGVCAND